MITSPPRLSNNPELTPDEISRSKSTQSFDDFLLTRYRNSNAKYDFSESPRYLDQNLISNKTCPERFEVDIEQKDILATRDFQLQPKSSMTLNIFKISCLLLSLIATSSILPFSVALPLESTLLKLCWRYSSMIPFLITLSLFQLNQQRNQLKLMELIKDKNVMILATKSAISLFLVQTTYLVSGQYTIISHATILSSFGGAIIVVYRFITKQRVHQFEYMGIAMATIGCVVSCMDEVSKVKEEDLNIPLGDACGLLCSVFMVINFNQTHELIKKVPSSLVTLYSISLGLILIIFFGLSFDTFTLDMDVETGVFGFFDEKYFLYTFLVLGFFTGTVSQVTEYQALKYFSPLVVINFLLFDPIISQILSCWMGIDHAPGKMTYFGGLFTLLGIFFVSYGGQKLSK